MDVATHAVTQLGVAAAVAHVAALTRAVNVLVVGAGSLTRRVGLLHRTIYLVVGKADRLAPGIKLTLKVAVGVVAVAPITHVRIGHRDLAPQSVVTYLRGVANRVGNSSQARCL